MALGSDEKERRVYPLDPPEALEVGLGRVVVVDRGRVALVSGTPKKLVLTKRNEGLKRRHGTHIVLAQGPSWMTERWCAPLWSIGHVCDGTSCTITVVIIRIRNQQSEFRWKTAVNGVRNLDSWRLFL